MENKVYLTPKEQMIFDFVMNYIIKFDYSPTQMEIARGTGLKRSLVAYYLGTLESKGVVDKRKNLRRTLKINSI